MSKKNSINKLLIFLYGLFISSTGITIVIVYKDLAYVWAFPFIISYLAFLLLFIPYLLFFSFIRIKKLTPSDIRKRFFRFLFYLLILSLISIAIDLFRITEMHFIESFGITFGMAIGVSFLDAAFTKNAH